MKIETLLHGANQFIFKPFDLDVMDAMMEKATRALDNNSILKSETVDTPSLEALIETILPACFANIENRHRGNIHAIIMEQLERPLLRLVLEHNRWDQVKAASILGIERYDLLKKMRALNIG